MRFPCLMGSALLLACMSLAQPAEAETCSSSTLDSPVFASARWCGDPPAPGTLRIARRDGRSEDFLDVPVDTYREVIRTPAVAKYVAEEIQPHFRAQPGPSTAARPPRQAAPRQAAKPVRAREATGERPVASKQASRPPQSANLLRAPARVAAGARQADQSLPARPVRAGREVLRPGANGLPAGCAAPASRRGAPAGSKTAEHQARNPACRG